MEPLGLFLFGKSGTGKSFVGDILQEALGCYVYHADTDLSEEMKTALNESKPFTNDMRDRYFSIVVEKILSLKKIHRCIVVTQGAYKKRHRDYLLTNITDLHLVYVQSKETLLLEKASKRQHGISSASTKALTDDFEAPESDIRVITNNGSKPNITKQIRVLAEAMPNKFSQQDAAKLRLC